MSITFMVFKGRAGSLYLFSLVFLVISLVTRVVLLVKALPNLDLTPLLLTKVFAVGFFFDCVTLSYFAIPFFLYALFVPDRVFRWRPILWTVSFLVTYALLFNMVAEYVFFDEFGSRYNFIAIDYLVYTTEVIRNIWESYPVVWIFGTILVLNIALFLFLRRYIDQARETVTTLGTRLKKGSLFALLPVMAVLFVDNSWNSVSRNNFANELASNGIYSLSAAFRNNELDFDRFYATGDVKLALERLRGMLKDEDETFLKSSGMDISRTVQTEGPEKKLNVIVIVEESLSADFLGTFGNRLKLTPNLDRIAGQSLLFTNLFATGTRTVRGLEAITLSVPPLPGCSLVKRPNNENLFSWGTVMKNRGYDTKFIYGGRGYFDNMNYFFSHNGFSIVDRADFSDTEKTFENAWGVCDEDLFGKVISEANRSFSEHKPFFSIVMTTSNHRPFTYPSGKVYVPAGSGREGGVMYADYAIGRLDAQARKQPWFNDTLFVIVADHCAASARKYALPVRKYHIPLIIYSPAHIFPRRVAAMASQIDIAPTVLGLLNVNYTSRFIGRDILDEDAGPRRAFISTYEKLGYLEDDKLLVLSPKKEISFYRCNLQDGRTTEIPLQDAYLQNALGYYQGTNYLYLNRHSLDEISHRILTSSKTSHTAKKLGNTGPVGT
jgi:phosphoglycerol transferase MdoB-like AlkP superfamily enzyme